MKFRFVPGWKSQVGINRMVVALMAGIISLSTVFPSAAAAANRKGIQAIVFSRWNATSVNNLIAVIQETATREIELAAVPFFNPANPFGNLQTFVDAMARLGVNLTLAVHLVGNHETLTAEARRNRIAQLDQFLLSNLGKIRTIKVIPKLEDDYPDRATFEQRCREIAAGLSTQILQKDLQFRRSGGSISPVLSVKSKTGQPFQILVQREVHGRESGGNAWSNDGFFVTNESMYLSPSNPPEKSVYSCSSCTPASDGDKGMKLDSFISRTNSFGGAALLWRPAYNLWSRETTTRNGVTYRNWVKRGAAQDRTDPIDKPYFDLQEKAIFKTFLNRVP